MSNDTPIHENVKTLLREGSPPQARARQGTPWLLEGSGIVVMLLNMLVALPLGIRLGYRGAELLGYTFGAPMVGLVVLGVASIFRPLRNRRSRAKVFLGLMFLFLLGQGGQAGSVRSKALPETVLARAAEEANRMLPRMVDRDTELSSTMALPGVLVYKYRLVNYSVDQRDPATLVAALRPVVTSSACTTPQTRDVFLKRGVTLRYTFADRDRTFIAEFDVNGADCKW
jgi:hypothetical protein